jgi:dTDP-4-amino-4,6-dideoxygalactose transaminase
LLTAIARRHGAFVVDDAAQAMGAAVDGRWAGTGGDAGLFSFDKGKNVSAIDGGVIVTNSDRLADVLRAEIDALARPGIRGSTVHLLKALGYLALLRPWLYGIPARIPQFGLGRTVYTTDYPLEQSDPILVALAATMMRRLDQFTVARRDNAALLLDALRGSRLTTISPRAGAAAVYLRLPVLVAGRREQVATIQALARAGIGATGSYPLSLADVPELQDALALPQPTAAGGRDVANRIVTLPTHPFVGVNDIRVMQTILVGGASRATPVSATAS